MPIRQAVRLTQSFVNSVASDGKRKMRYWDASVPGLVLTVSRAGSKGYYVVYRDIEGRQREPMVGDAKILTLEQARVAAMGVLSSSRLTGADPVAAKRAARQAAMTRQEQTVDKLWEVYLADFERRRAKSRNELETGYYHRHVAPVFGTRPVKMLTPTEIGAHILSLSKSSGIAAANTTLEVIRRMLGFGVTIGWIETNPALHIRAFPKASRERVATQEEIASIWRALQGLRNAGRSDCVPSVLVLQLAILTLQRRGEVCGIHWSEIDWSNRIWTIPGARTKNKKGAHVVPLSDLANDVLVTAFAGRQTGFAFLGRAGQPLDPHVVTRFFSRLTETLEIESLTVHDLRRTGATMLTSERLNVMGEIVSRILNHTPPGPAITQVYNRNNYLPQKREAMNNWAKEVQRLSTSLFTSFLADDH